MKKKLAKIEQVVRRFGTFPDYHEPLCRRDDPFCSGCSWRRSRLNRNRRAARSVGVGMLADGGDQAERECAGCKAPAYRGLTGEQGVPVLAWNHCTERAEWSMEEVGAHALCPRCRAKANAA